MVKTPPSNAGDAGLVPGSGRFPREGNGNPSHYSCPENPMNKRAWRAAAYGVSKELDTTYQLNKKPGGLQPMGFQKSWTQLIN